MSVSSAFSGKPEKSQQWPQILAVFSAALLALGMGFQNGWPSPSVPKLLSNDLGFEVTVEEVSYVVMIAPLGYLLGSPLAGLLLDRIGRKYTLLLLAVPEIIPCLMVANANSVVILYIARFITGIADGALFTALPVYMGEVLEPKIRGYGTCLSLGILSGALLINVYGSYVPIRIAAYISLAAPLVFLATFVWMPESPYYFLMKGRTEDARKSLKRLRRMKNVETELSKITADVQRQISEPGTLRDIFTIKSNLKGFFILIGLRTFQQISGITALAFYIQVIFAQVGGGLTPAESGIICAGVQLMFACCGSLIVDRFGRKPLLITSSIGSATLLSILGLYFTLQRNGYDMSNFLWVPIIGMVLFNGICTIGILIIPNLMASEIMSASIKSKALGILHMYLGVIVSVTAKVYQWLDHDFGMNVPFFVFSICCFTSAVFCYFCVPETKGKTLEEIQQGLKGNDGTNTVNIKNKEEEACETKGTNRF